MGRLIRCSRARWGGVPVHVEKQGGAGRLPVFQKIPPPGVLEMRGHVVGDDIQNHPHAAAGERLAQTFEIRPGADIGVQTGGIGDVVAVDASRTGREKGRGVDGRYAELFEIRNETKGLGQTKSPVKPHPVGCKGPRIPRLRLRRHRMSSPSRTRTW